MIVTLVPSPLCGMLRREVPENLWIKCPETGQLVFCKDVEANLFVVPGSNYHSDAPKNDRGFLLSSPWAPYSLAGRQAPPARTLSGDCRTSSGSLAMLAAMRRASKYIQRSSLRAALNR